MAAKSIVDVAMERIDAQIADLERAKALILEASSGEGSQTEPKAKRGRGKAKAKPGLPTEPSL